MRFSLYSYEYGGIVLSGVIHSDFTLVTWIAGQEDVSIQKETLVDTFSLAPYRIDKLKYYCFECKETLNCMFGKPCSFGIPIAKKLTLWKGL